jgi:major type 1 subunit fimbrin (pilin)
MKKYIVGCCAAIGLAGAALAPLTAHAYDGVINFSGTIGDVTCNINGKPPGPSNDRPVMLTQPGQPLSPSYFDAIGKQSTAVPFDLVLSGPGCTNDAKVVIDFDGGSPNIDTSTGNLKLVGTKPATGVQIEVRDAGNGKAGKIQLGTPQDINAAQVATIKDNTATLRYTANYVSIAAKDAITPGSADSFIRYTLAYH